MIVTADGEEELERIKGVARKHLAFYGSTPAYRPTLACHGWEALHEELNQLSKRGRWDEMAELVDDDLALQQMTYDTVAASSCIRMYEKIIVPCSAVTTVCAVLVLLILWRYDRRTRPQLLSHRAPPPPWRSVPTSRPSG